MTYATFLVALAVASLTACGKTEEAPAVDAAPAQVEPAAIATPEPIATAEPEQSASPAVATTDTPPSTVAPPKAVPQSVAATQPAQPTASAKAEPASEAVPAASHQPDLAHGQQIYRQACAFCHDKGVAGAPKMGDAAAWSPRLAQGMDTLYASALNGKNAMPAKGGNPSLAEADVKAAVGYLAAQAR